MRPHSRYFFWIRLPHQLQWQGFYCKQGQTACQTVCCPSGQEEVGVTGVCSNNGATALATIRPPRLVVDLSPAESGWIKSPSPLPPSSAWKPTATTSSALPVSPHAPSPVVERANTNGSTRSTISSLAVGARAWARVRIVPPSRARGGWDATWANVRSTRAGVGSERLAGTRASRCKVDLGAWRAVGHQDIISLYLDMMDFISPGGGLSSPSAAPQLTKLCGEKLLRSSLLPKSVIRDNTLASSRFSSRYS